MLKNAMIKTVMDQISERSHRANTYITEAELAEKVQISRTRLRETLQTLSAYGIVEKRQKRGVTLKAVTPESIRETYELRELLESHAAGYALEKVTAEDIKQLEELEEDLERATQMGYFDIAVNNDIKFHNKIIEISGLQLMNIILRSLSLMESSFRMTMPNGEWPAKKLNPNTHHAIIEALKNKDPECPTILRKHIEWIKNESLNAIKLKTTTKKKGK
jgi:DNA-binding GntR family transcriptional regulator